MLANNSQYRQQTSELKEPSAISTNLTLSRPNTSFPHTDLTPQFDIFLGNDKVGYISRGHAMLRPEFRGRGIFQKAVELLENIECKFYADGKFNSYKTEILRLVGATAGQAESTLFRLQTPHHIEYWRHPHVAATFLSYGYELDFHSLQTLRRMQLIRDGADTCEIKKALLHNSQRLAGQIVCILTKAAQLQA